MADLANRLSAIQNGPVDTGALGIAGITSNIDTSLAGLAALEQCCFELYQKGQEEKSAEEERNREFCPPATTDHQVLDNYNGAQNILRGIR